MTAQQGAGAVGAMSMRAPRLSAIVSPTANHNPMPDFGSSMSDPFGPYWDSETRGYVVPVGELGRFKLGDIPGHSTIHVSDLPPVPEPYEAELTVTNGGEDGTDEYLSVFCFVGFESEDPHDPRAARLRRAYRPLVDARILPEPMHFPMQFRRGYAHGPAFTIECRGRREQVIGEAVQPAVLLLRKVADPVARVLVPRV